MTDLPALLSRLEAAEGEDRELDGLLAKLVGDLPAEAYWSTQDVYGYSTRYWVSGGYGAYKFYDPEPYTASLDAAIALAERALPEWQIISFTMGWRGPGKLHDHLPETWRKRYAKADLEIACVAHVRRSEHSYVSAASEAPTPALALCIAIVKALIAQEKDKQDE